MGQAGRSSSGSSAGRAFGIAQMVVQQVTPPEIFSDVMTALDSVIPNFVSELATSLTPFVGVIATGGGAAYAGVKGLKMSIKANRFEMHSERSFSIEEPEAAYPTVSW